MLYQGVINRIKQSPIGRRRLRSITSDMLQTYMDSLCFLSTGYVRVYQAVLQGAFRYAVFPGKFLAHNPMQYVTRKEKRQEPALFESEETVREVVTHAQFLTLCSQPPFAGGAAAGGCGPFRFCLPERGRIVYIAGPGGENL